MNGIMVDVQFVGGVKGVCFVGFASSSGSDICQQIREKIMNGTEEDTILSTEEGVEFSFGDGKHFLKFRDPAHHSLLKRLLGSGAIQIESYKHEGLALNGFIVLPC